MEKKEFFFRISPCLRKRNGEEEEERKKEKKKITSGSLCLAKEGDNIHKLIHVYELLYTKQNSSHPRQHFVQTYGGWTAWNSFLCLHIKQLSSNSVSTGYNEIQKF